MSQKDNARVAQLVEQRTENPRVGGSIPSPSTISKAPFRELFVYTLKGDEALDTSSWRRSRIKTTTALVVFTARGVVLLKF